MSSKKSSTIAATMLAVIACMMFVNNSFTVFLFPFLIGLPFWAIRNHIIRFFQSDWRMTIFLGIVALGYFSRHAIDILSLELWADEIVAISLVSEPFFLVAKRALFVGDIPPFHYWELWIWHRVVHLFSVQSMEFLYRIPSMTYHTVGALLFSLIILKLYLRMNHTIYMPSFLVRSISFALYFFHPLLLPYALEARPYALMAFGSVLLLTGAVSPLVSSMQFIPVQILLFLTSFFHIVLYMLKSVLTIGEKTSHIVTGITLIFCIIFTAFCLPFISVPSHTTSDISTPEIIRILWLMFTVFAPTTWVGVLFLISIISSLRIPRLRLFLFQTIGFLIIVSLSAYMLRYQAPGTRHYISIIPFVLSLMTAPLVFPNKIIQYASVGIFLVFVFQWVGTTEYVFKTESFAPKIAIGIKSAIQKANQKHHQITLEINTRSKKDEQHYTNHYLEKQALWYLHRYGYTNPTRILESELCAAVASGTTYIIAFTPQPCFAGHTNVSVLSRHVREPNYTILRFGFGAD